MKYIRTLVSALSVMALLSGGVFAAEGEGEGEVKVGEGDGFIPLYKGKPYLHVMHEGRSVKVQRVQDPDYELRGYFAKTTRKCPPFCLKPISVDPKVRTAGEIEIFDFMENQLREGNGLLIDARTPSWHKKGTIPGSINIPFTTLSKKITDAEMVETLRFLGAKPREEVGTVTRTLEKWGLSESEHMTDKWDFSGCKDLIIWCNGPACGQSPRAIQGLLSVGYPAEKLAYYRGGMQIWQLFGLTTVTPVE
ncbi:MAG: rhodanese-like domain-containing protein [Sedimenticola sp.]